jgi:hypothetical protein
LKNEKLAQEIKNGNLSFNDSYKLQRPVNSSPFSIFVEAHCRPRVLHNGHGNQKGIQESLPVNFEEIWKDLDYQAMPKQAQPTIASLLQQKQCLVQVKTNLKPAHQSKNLNKHPYDWSCLVPLHGALNDKNLKKSTTAAADEIDSCFLVVDLISQHVSQHSQQYFLWWPVRGAANTTRLAGTNILVVQK